MIVSHQHRFIFLKTKKTAGTSVELALSTICGPEDVITPIFRPDEELRAEVAGRPPQNYSIPLSRWGLRDWGRFMIRRRRATYHSHVEADRVRAVLGETTWNSYFKFTFERNPWDKAVSLYFWRMRYRKQKPTFSEFLRTVSPYELSNAHIYMASDQPVVDEVFRFEDLAGGMQHIAERLGLNGELSLPHAKGGVRKDDGGYRQHFAESDRELVAAVCRREIALLGYAF